MPGSSGSTATLAHRPSDGSDAVTGGIYELPWTHLRELFMAKLLLPAGAGGASYGEYDFDADANGVIDTEDAPRYVVDILIAQARAVEIEQTEEELSAEDQRAKLRASVIAQLQASGIAFDGRTKLETLQALLESNKKV
jgi:hypothetical protein